MKNPVDISRLGAAIRQSRQVLKYARETRREMVRQHAGFYWSEDAAPIPVPLNLLALYTQIVTRTLIAHNPRAMFSTFDSSIKSQIYTMEKWSNREIERQYFAETVQEIVFDALFNIGIAKVCLTTPSESALYGYSQRTGQARVSRVDLDDFVYDTNARNFLEASFIGHRIRVPYEWVKESKLYNAKARKNLQPTPLMQHNIDGDERIGQLGRGSYGLEDDFLDYVDLWEIYVPSRRLVITLPADAEGPDDRKHVLRETQWIGPDCGPYHFLRFGIVPGNAMPKAPIQDLFTLHMVVNNLLRKSIRQAERQKSVLLYRKGLTEDAEAITNAADGEAIGLNGDPTMAALAMDYGGANAPNLAMTEALKQLFSWVGGNLDLLGGLSPQSKTATQDKMLNENSSRQIADMQDTVTTFTTNLIRSLAWYWWHDPFTAMKANYDVPGMEGMSVGLEPVTPQMRQMGRFEDLDIRIDAYSMRPTTPEAKAQQLKQVVAETIAPMMGLLAQQGIAFDANAFLSKLGRLTNMTDLSEIIGIVEPPEPHPGSGGGLGGGEEGAGMPANTTRTYERVSRPGRTDRGDAQNRLNSLMGVDPGGDPSGSGQQMGA